jgi:hypothetical protein
MANFNTHFIVASSASAIVSGVMLSMEIIEPNQAIMAFVIGTFGGLLPDIDSNNSKSISIAFTIISFLITILIIFFKSSTYSIIEMIIVGGMVFYTIRFGLIGVFRKVSKHRGMFHSIPVALIWGVATAILMNLFFGLDELVSWIYGFMMSFGYIIHLILDEIYSVDLANRRLKKSSGTAFKFFKLKTQKDKIQNILIYAFLIFLLYNAPDATLFKNALFSKEAWLNFKDVLLPYDGKWFIH